MISLSRETEVLARHIAAVRRLPVEDVVRAALEEQARIDGIDHHVRRLRNPSPEAIEGRRARTKALVAALAALPVHDDRSPRDIMDDLNGP